MAVAARAPQFEKLPNQGTDQIHSHLYLVEESVAPQPDEPLVYSIPELSEDKSARHQAAQFIGAVALGGWKDIAPQPEAATTIKPLESLHEAIQAAALGDKTAYKMVKINAATDVIERTIKTGHIMKVDLMADEAGKIQQNGQSMQSVQANSLRFAADSWQMRERTEAETRNAFRIEQHHNQGKLQDYSFVVFSRTADNMTRAESADAGFFIETMSCAIQVTTSENSRLVTESAFVSGIKDDGEARHDEDTIIKLARRLGVDMDGKSAAEIIDTPLLVHKSLLPNGAADLVEMYDDCAGGTFFGEAKPRQDYIDYKQICAEREQRFAPKVEKIVNQLISEARHIRNPLMATQRLHKISEEQMIQQAIGDEDIDVRVFGSISAAHLEQARQAYREGQPEAVLVHLRDAVNNARSSSCPGAGLGSADGETENSQDSSEDCEFTSKECPMCHAKNVKTRVTKTRISGSCGCSKDR